MLKKSKNKGITLIALVITIIVMLILAAISITMLTGDNSILKRAVDAKERTGIAEIEERIKLSYNSALTEDLTTGNGKVQEGTLRRILTSEFPGKEIDINTAGEEWVITIDGVSVNVPAGKKGEDSTPKFVLSIKGTKVNETTPPNPDSNVFVHVDGTTIDNGYVIRDKNIGNEFVWVPVEKDQKITLDVVKEEEITGIKLTDPSGANIDLGISGTIGKSYKNENIEPTYNGEYKAEVTTASGTTSETLIVRSLYATDTFNDYYTDEKIEGEIFGLWNSRVRGQGNVATVCQRLGLGDNKTMVDFKAWILGTSYTELEDHKRSVNDNGGFYIGRYEAGIDEQRTSGDSSTDGDTMLAPLSKADVFAYNYVTRSQASKIEKKMYPGKSYLLTNAAWDRTLGWIKNSNDKNLALEDIIVDSKSWGNYSDSAFEGHGSLAKTGAFGNNTKVNNAYDLSGNVFEFTSAKSPHSSAPCVARGGDFTSTGSVVPASYRSYGGEIVCRENNGFRVALFL